LINQKYQGFGVYHKKFGGLFQLIVEQMSWEQGIMRHKASKVSMVDTKPQTHLN
jgi:hypothetical protein